MKIIVLLTAIAVAWPAWAQAPAPVVDQMQTEAEKPAATPAKSVRAPKAHKVRSKVGERRQQDARHCLERPNNDAIIRCAEEYL